jgi:putative nucleotidyltransferase with HDIG domain
VILVSGSAIVLAVVLVAHGWTIGNAWVVIGLGLFAAAAERSRVSLTGATGEVSEESISLVPSLFAAVAFGPLAAMVVGALSMAAEVKPPHLRWITYASTRSLTGALSGLAATEAMQLSSTFLGSILLATASAAVVAEALDLFFFTSIARLRGLNAMGMLGSLKAPVIAGLLLYPPLVALLAFAYVRLSPWALVMFFVPALAAQRLFGLYQEQRRLAVDLSAANVRLERANLSFATALVATLDARDRYTAGHSAAVAIYARDITRRLELPEGDRQLAHVCGLVHDIGKIGLSPGLLEKPGALTLAERRQMEKHSVIGERILAKVEDYAEIARIVRHHHERWDGQGYPDGLTGDEIPLISRIITVADAYNAMTSDRPYRDAMPSRVARMRLAQGVESQFDTTVVAAFEAILAGETDEYRTARRADFTLADQDTYSELDIEEPSSPDELAIADVA